MTGDAKRKSARILLEPAVVLVVFLISAWIGGSYRATFFASGAPEDYGQAEFAAGVALACGRGFLDPGYAPSPAVGEFLQRKRDSITCADLPRDIPLQRPNLTQGLYRYMMSAAALIWMATGVISWSGLTPMFAVAYGVTVAAAYGLFRVGIGLVMSLVATLAVMVSAVHVGYLPYFRDYAKAPFILTLILIMARLPTRSLTWRRAVGYGVAFGLVLGIGFGFRNDLLINIVPWAAVVLLCLPGSLLSNLKAKALCLASSAIVFVMVAWPILAAYSRGSNSGHVALLGLMSSFNAPLGVAASIYDWGYYYNDGFANRLVNSFTYRQYGHPVLYLTQEYDQAMVEYILKIVRYWPADIVARAYGSALKIVNELPFAVGAYAHPIPYGVHDPTVIAVYHAQIVVLRTLHGTGLLALVLALLVISARSVRAALTLLVFILYFAGYPAIQFNVRHFFHLEFITWWAVAFLIDRSVVTLWRQRYRLLARSSVAAQDAPRLRRVAARVSTFALVGAIVVLGPLVTLRAYQTAHLRHMLENSYLEAQREPVDTAKVNAQTGKVLIETPTLWGHRNAAEEFSMEYIVAEFSPTRCNALQVSATFRYAAKSADSDFSHDVKVRLIPGDRSTLVFFPAFYDPTWSQFRGIEIDAVDIDCLVGVSRIQPERIPEVLLDAQFTPNWKRATLYQTLAQWETSHDGEPLPAVYAYPPSIQVRNSLEALKVTEPQRAYLSPIVKRGASRTLVIKGRPETPLSYAVLVKNQHLDGGAAVIARGQVHKGGITLGVLNGDKWAGNVNVTSRGPFVAAVGVANPGTYTIAIANYVTGGWLQAHLPERLGNWLLQTRPFARGNDVVITELGLQRPAQATREELLP